MPVEVLSREGYTEFRAYGRVSLEEWVPVEEMGISDGLRLLIDYSEVEEIRVPVDMFVSAVKHLVAHQAKVAMLAPGNLAFGLSRQALQLAEVTEGPSISVFREREPAIKWLLGEGPPQPDEGSVSRSLLWGAPSLQDDSRVS